MTAYVYSWAIIAASVSTYATLKHQDREIGEKMDSGPFTHANGQSNLYTCIYTKIFCSKHLFATMYSWWLLKRQVWMIYWHQTLEQIYWQKSPCWCTIDSRPARTSVTHANTVSTINSYFGISIDGIWVVELEEPLPVHPETCLWSEGIIWKKISTKQLFVYPL